MSKLRTHLQKETDSLRLGEAEKNALRTAVFAYADAHPLGGMKSPWHFVLLDHAPQMMAVVLIFALCTGTAYAAQGALPGDTLYTIKTQVNEKIVEALAVSDAAKAKVHTQLASVRLEEAQSLAAEGKLSAATAQTITQNFDEHAAEAATLAGRVDAVDPDEGATIRAQLHVLNAEGRVLATVGGRSHDSDTAENSRGLADHVRLAVAPEDTSAAATAMPTAAAMMARTADTINSASMTQTESAPVREKSRGKGSGRLKERAQKTLTNLEHEVSSRAANTDATTTATLQAQILDTRRHIDEGDNASSSDDASHHYEQALSQGGDLQTFIEADSRFKGNILQPLLHGDDADRNDDRGPSGRRNSGSGKGGEHNDD